MESNDEYMEDFEALEDSPKQQPKKSITPEKSFEKEISQINPTNQSKNEEPSSLYELESEKRHHTNEPFLQKFSRHNSQRSNNSSKNLLLNQPSKSNLRSLSSKPPRQNSFINQESNFYSKKIEKICLESSQSQTESQLIKENNLLRIYLKDFNTELNSLVEKSRFRKPPKPILSNKEKTFSEEFKNNQKKCDQLSEECKKLSKRLEIISEGKYLFTLSQKIDEAKKNIEETKKFNKLVLIEQKKKGKNLDEIENIFGQPEELKKGNDITSLLPGLTRKNKELIEKNKYTILMLQENETKNEKLDLKLEKILELEKNYKIYKTDENKKNKFDITQNRIDLIEKTIENMKKSKEKIIENLKKIIDDMKKDLKDKDELIFLKEKEIIEIRKKIEDFRAKSAVSKSESGFITEKKNETDENFEIFKENEKSEKEITFIEEKKIHKNDENNFEKNDKREEIIEKNDKKEEKIEKEEEINVKKQETHQDNTNENSEITNENLKKVEIQPKLFNFAKKQQEKIENPPPILENNLNLQNSQPQQNNFNFSKKNENNKSNETQNPLQNIENSSKNTILQQKHIQKIKNTNLWEDNTLGNIEIPEITTLNQEKAIQNIENTNIVTENIEKNDVNIKKKVFSDPFEQKETNLESSDDWGALNKGKSRIKMPKKPDEKEIATKAEKGETDFFAGFD